MSTIFRPTTARLLTATPTRSSALYQSQILHRTPRQQSLQSLRFATNATEPLPPSSPPPPSGGASGGGGGGGGGNNQMYIVLGAVVALGAGGYYFLKPVRDVASTTHQVINSVKGQASGLGGGAASLSGIAQAMLPPGAMALYTSLANQEGGINGFLTSLKDKDLQGVMEEVKKVGGDEVKRVVDKVEKRVKDANGKVQNVDWQALAKELKEELPKDKQHYVEMLIGKLPSKEDVDRMITKAKDMGEDQLKQVEQAASKIMAEVNKAKKEGKGQADAFLAGLKEAAPQDVDSLVKQLKEAAKKAGLPADQAEAWLKSKAQDGKIDAEALGKQIEDKLRTAAHFIPGNPKDLVEQVKQISPSVAQLLLQAMEQAGITDSQGNRK